MRKSVGAPADLNGTLASTESYVIDLDKASSVSVQVNYVDSAPAAKTFKSLADEIQTITLPAKAGATGGDYVVVETSAGVKYAVALNVSGTDPAPTGAIYTAIAAARKTNKDISAATDAASVAALVATAFNSRTGFTAAITITDNADGTLTFTQITEGPTVNPVVKNEDDSGAGSILGVEATAGAVSNIDLTSDYITITSHGFSTGLKAALTTAGVLPTGLSATNYYMIKIDDDTIQLASSLANAEAGTKVNITGEGTGTHTLTPSTSASNVFKLQKSNDNSNWTDISSMTVTIATTTGTSIFEIASPAYRYMRALYTPSAGQVILTTYVCLAE
jgi:hypothetical protein